MQGSKRCMQCFAAASELSAFGCSFLNNACPPLELLRHPSATTGPAAALATGSWLWSLVSPSSHVVCSAVVALMAVAADYNSLGRDVARGKIPPGAIAWAAAAGVSGGY